MYSKHRRIPLEVSHWMEKDVKITNSSVVDSGSIANDAERNLLLNRQFYLKMLSISYDRYRKTALFDFQKQTFLNNQRSKAETSMQGLLPYIDQLTDEMNQKTPSNRGDPLISSSFKSVSSRSLMKSQPTLFTTKIKTLKLVPIKPSDRPKKPLEQMNYLTRPKDHRLSTSTNDRTHSSIDSPTAEDLFGNIDEISNYNCVLPEIPNKSTEDKRFRQLIHLFSEVHERKPSKLQSLKTIVQLNSSLQVDPTFPDDQQDQEMYLIDMNTRILKNLPNKRSSKSLQARGFEYIEMDTTTLGTATDVKSTK